MRRRIHHKRMYSSNTLQSLFCLLSKFKCCLFRVNLPTINWVQSDPRLFLFSEYSYSEVNQSFSNVLLVAHTHANRFSLRAKTKTEPKRNTCQVQKNTAIKARIAANDYTIRMSLFYVHMQQDFIYYSLRLTTTTFLSFFSFFLLSNQAFNWPKISGVNWFVVIW